MRASEQPTIILAATHKAASSFLAGSFAAMLARTLPGLMVIPFGYKLIRGTPAEQMALPAKGALVTRVYPEHLEQLVERPEPARGRFEDKKIIVVRRDPRDAAVSLHYSAAYSHPVPPGAEEWFVARRQELQALGAREGIKAHTARSAIEEFRMISAVLARTPWALDVPYELLVTDMRGWLERVVVYLGWNAAVVDAFAPVLAREVAAPAVEDVNKHKRRVTPGNWRDVFDSELCDMFEREIGEEMRAAGYEWNNARQPAGAGSAV